jgi:hypothetical protein
MSAGRNASGASATLLSSMLKDWTLCTLTYNIRFLHILVTDAQLLLQAKHTNENTVCVVYENSDGDGL